MDAPRHMLVAPKARKVRKGKATGVSSSFAGSRDDLECTPMSGNIATRQRNDPTYSA